MSKMQTGARMAELGGQAGEEARRGEGERSGAGPECVRGPAPGSRYFSSYVPFQLPCPPVAVVNSRRQVPWPSMPANFP